MKKVLRFTAFACAPVLLLACALVSLPAGSGAAPTLPANTASAGSVATEPVPVPVQATRPEGITAVNNFLPAAQAGNLFTGELFQDQTYSNPSVAGLTFRTGWADIEPGQGRFVWDKLDTVFDKAEKNGKWVELVLIPGFASPGWALQGVPTGSFSILYGPGKGQSLALPLPWNPIYLGRWFTFLKTVSERYQNRPSFLKIAADGPTSMTGEMTLPDTPADICTWVKVGYTSERIIDAWKQVFAQYAQIFPRQYFSLANYPPLPIVSATRCQNGKPSGVDHNESMRVRDAIFAMGVDNYPKRFVLQSNGLIGADQDPTQSAYELIKSYGGKVLIGYQLATSAMQNPEYMGGVADGATALQKSLQKGVDAHAQFLEVYEPDVLSPAAQRVLAAIAAELAAQAH